MKTVGPHIHRRIRTPVPHQVVPMFTITPVNWCNCGLHKGSEVLKVSCVVMETKSTKYQNLIMTVDTHMKINRVKHYYL